MTAAEAGLEATNPGTGSGTQRKQAEAVGLLWLPPFEHLGFWELGDSLLIGRSATCDLVLDTNQVSREHLRLHRSGPLVVAEDQGSRNGSYLNGRPFTREPTEHGAVLRVGNAVALLWQSTACSEFRELAEGLFGGLTLAQALTALPRIAEAGIPVVVRGPTGSGKEAVARAVHHYTGRSGPFIGVNCATIPEQLAEAQLFGHRRGAFTGATSSEEGYFRAAQGGTLFLDEVVELPLGVQAKLLRVLQEREYCPVGETRTVRSDVRLVAAAQLPLDHYVRRGTLRQDLATRLEGYEVILPELSARREDIPYLFLKFLRDDLGEQTPKLHARAVEALCLYPWPGNVRELQHVAKQMAVLRRGEPELRLEHLPERVTDLRGEVDEASSVDAPQPSASSGALVKDADQLALLGQALFEHAGNVQRAAQQLGISRGRAYRLIAQGRLDIAKIRGT